MIARRLAKQVPPLGLCCVGESPFAAVVGELDVFATTTCFLSLRSSAGSARRISFDIGGESGQSQMLDFRALVADDMNPGIGPRMALDLDIFDANMIAVRSGHTNSPHPLIVCVVCVGTS